MDKTKALEATMDKLYRHSYSMVGHDFLPDVIQAISEHKYFRKYEVLITNEDRLFSKVSLKGKMIYSN